MLVDVQVVPSKKKVELEEKLKEEVELVTWLAVIHRGASLSARSEAFVKELDVVVKYRRLRDVEDVEFAASWLNSSVGYLGDFRLDVLELSI